MRSGRAGAWAPPRRGRGTDWTCPWPGRAARPRPARATAPAAPRAVADGPAVRRSRVVVRASGRAVEVAAPHRVVVAGDVALAEDVLEQVCVAGARAEHLGRAHQVAAPDAAEALVEPFGVERLDRRPLALEAQRPLVERERVVAAQVLDVDHFEAAALHLDDGIGQARDPAAGEDVLADEQLGVVTADVADEVQHAEPAG